MNLFIKINVYIGLFLIVLTASEAIASETRIACGEKNFVINRSFFGSEFNSLIKDNVVPYCVSTDQETISQKKSYRDGQMWCITLFHITADTHPYAKATSLFNEKTQIFYEYQYLWRGQGWVQQSSTKTNCSSLLVKEDE